MLTVSAAAAKVCPGDASGPGEDASQRAVPGASLDKSSHLNLCIEDLL